MPSKKNKKLINIEQYQHSQKRKNNPEVGSVTSENLRPLSKTKKYKNKKHNYSDPNEDDVHLEPQLQWAEKKKRTDLEVPTVSLHTHEKIDPRTIIEKVRATNSVDYENLSLFEKEKKENPKKSDIEYYKHKNQWKNRLICGDSLLVMNSLLEKENMAGKIQCIYIDPPYGISYGSNFQPFTNKKNVKDKKDEDLTIEPEQIKAFRDTWELGIHSYLSYMRDRLLLSKQLLTESGSCFVQISDENVHLIRILMDEIFGKENFIALIPFKTKNRPMNSKHLEQMCDFIVWYSKDKKVVKYNKLYVEKNIEGNNIWKYIGFPDGSYRTLTKEEIDQHTLLKSDFKKGGKIFRSVSIEPVGVNESRNYGFEFEGKKYKPKHSWKYSKETMNYLAKNKLLISSKNTLNGKYFFNFFPMQALTIPWKDINLGNNKVYAVQTASTVIERCILMTTDPSDLVLDPTCGSGTTAYVAEKFGRRWITCDTSRIAITLAKKRLMTSYFDYYKLANEDEDITSGFQYKTVPHVTLGSIANNEPAKEEVLYDQPLIDSKKARVTSPFTVEAVPSHTVESLGETDKDYSLKTRKDWLDEIKLKGIRGKQGLAGNILFSKLEILDGTKYLFALGETKELKPKKVAISFGSDFSPMEQRQIHEALKEAKNLNKRPDLIIFLSVQFDSEASKDIAKLDFPKESKWDGMQVIKAQMNADLFTEDLKKKVKTDDVFWLIGEPDIKIKKLNEDKLTVEILGFDYYNTKTNSIQSGDQSRIAMWMLDTNYDSKSFYPRQVFFPNQKDGWQKLEKALKSEIDHDLIQKFEGCKSIPFKVGDNNKIAIKIIDDRGIESLVVKDDLKVILKKKTA